MSLHPKGVESDYQNVASFLACGKVNSSKQLNQEKTMRTKADTNKQVLTCVNETLKAKLIELDGNYIELCYTDDAKKVIGTALGARASDMVGCLNTLAKVTTRLATPKPDALLPLHEYSYQGSEKLYDLLNDIRHEYRMMEFDLKDKGISVDTSEATNNMLFLYAAN